MGRTPTWHVRFQDGRSSANMRFEDLESWQSARSLVRSGYALTRNGPLSRDYGVCGQIQRAAVSIMSNVAEGFERLHVPEKLQAYNVARGSCAEVRSLLYVIEDNFPDAAEAVAQLREATVSTGKLVTGLIRATESRKPRSGTATRAVLSLFGL